jgi:hypothetical protein
MISTMFDTNKYYEGILREAVSYHASRVKSLQDMSDNDSIYHATLSKGPYQDKVAGIFTLQRLNT